MGYTRVHFYLLLYNNVRIDFEEFWVFFFIFGMEDKMNFFCGLLYMWRWRMMFVCLWKWTTRLIFLGPVRLE